MVFSIPGEKKEWKGILPGNYGGNLWQTFNVDLERQPGRIVLSDKLRRFSAGLGVVTKFIRTDATATDQWFGIVNGVDIVRNGNASIDSGSFVTDDTTGTFNDPLDAVVHELANGEQRLLCSRATDIAILNKSGGANVWDDDWWTTVASGPALTDLPFHPMAKLQRLVAVGDKQSGVPVIHTLDKDDVVQASRLTFGAEYTVRCIYATSNRFWIGLQHNQEGKAKVIEWDGFSLTYNNEYELAGSYPISGFIANDVPYFITERGYIFGFNGSSFEQVGDFGLSEQRVYFGATTVAAAGIVPYGAHVEGDVVYLNVAAPTLQGATATAMQFGVRRARAGVWIFNTKTRNLYHHMGIGEHASAGTDVNYGCSPVVSVGAVLRAYNSFNVVCSASVYIGGATWQASSQSGIYLANATTIQGSNTGRNRGYIITPYLPLEEVEGMWEAIWVKFKKFVNSGNRIVVKWRVVEPLYLSSAQDQSGNSFDLCGLINAPGTWVNTTSFTCKVPTGVVVGNEVEILSGDNAGCSFKIATLSGTPDNSTLLTVTIAETAPTSSTDTFVCRFDNWTTETAISDTAVGNKKVPFTATAHGEFIQLKIELQGFDMHLDEIIPVLKSKTAAKQT